MRTQYLLIVTSLELGLEPSRKIASLLCAHCRRLKKLSDMSRARRRIQRRRRALSLRKKRKQPTRRVDKAFETVDNRLQSSLSEKIVVTSSTESPSSSSSSPRRSSSSCSSKKGRPETHFMCTLNSLLLGGVEFSSSRKKYFGTDWSGARGWGTTFRESRKLFSFFSRRVHDIFHMREPDPNLHNTEFLRFEKNVIHPKKNSITKKSIAVNALLWPEFVSGWAIHDFTHSRSFSQDLVCR